jgi:hypothetical protein
MLFLQFEVILLMATVKWDGGSGCSSLTAGLMTSITRNRIFSSVLSTKRKNYMKHLKIGIFHPYTSAEN